jgi:hypothetical protein
MFLHNNNVPSEHDGRKLKGTLGCRRRRVILHHLGLKVCIDDLNKISVHPLKMQWADGQILSTYITAAQASSCGSERAGSVVL